MPRTVLQWGRIVLGAFLYLMASLYDNDVNDTNLASTESLFRLERFLCSVNRRYLLDEVQIQILLCDILQGPVQGCSNHLQCFQETANLAYYAKARTSH